MGNPIAVKTARVGFPPRDESTRLPAFPLSSGGYVTSFSFARSLCWFDMVGSRAGINLRPSHLDLDVPVSVHPAPDILNLRFCLC